jgi:hypothetical protein
MSILPQSHETNSPPSLRESSSFLFSIWRERDSYCEETNGGDEEEKCLYSEAVTNESS